MRFLIINTDYQLFLLDFYQSNPGIENRSYDEQMRARMDSLFGLADFYSTNLKRLGHDGWEVHANNVHAQMAWVREHGLSGGRGWKLKTSLVKNRIPGAPRGWDTDWIFDILMEQVTSYQPDVLINQAMDELDIRRMRKLKKHVHMLVGQHAAPLPENQDYSDYDLVVSSLPNLVDYFRSRGVKSELNRLAFEPSVLSRLGAAAPTIPVSFVGSVSPAHKTRHQLLSHLCENLDIEIWGHAFDRPAATGSLAKCYKGRAWGKDMYRILQSSKITINKHIEISGAYANNLRLFEATGVGCLLVTDWKENLGEMFEPDKEVVSYRTNEECLELVKYFLENEEERAKIAKAGQERTLREHTYYNRVKELVDIVRKYQ